jgi:hypothetical protein
LLQTYISLCAYQCHQQCDFLSGSVCIEDRLYCYSPRMKTGRYGSFVAIRRTRGIADLTCESFRRRFIRTTTIFRTCSCETHTSHESSSSLVRTTQRAHFRRLYLSSVTTSACDEYWGRWNWTWAIRGLIDGWTRTLQCPLGSFFAWEHAGKRLRTTC